MKASHFVLRALDAIGAAVVLGGLVSSSTAQAILPKRGRRSPSAAAGETAAPRRLLVLDTAYAIATIRARGLEQFVTQRDLDGFFEHVWTVHPCVGSSAGDDLPEASVGSPSSEPLAPRHTFVEGRVAYSRNLRGLPMSNFMLAQWQILRRIQNLVRENGIQAVRVCDPFYLGLLGLCVSKTCDIPLMIFVISNYDLAFAATGRAAYPRLLRSRRVENVIERFVYRHSAVVAGGNQNNANYAMTHGATAEQTTLCRIGNAIDALHFAPPENRPDVTTELGLERKSFVAYVGRLALVKHPADVVRATAEVNALLAPRKVQALLIGDGELRESLEQLARELGIEDRIVFAGNRDQAWIANAMAAAGVVASPLTGRSLVEAALAAAPIVAYDVEWHGELVKDGVTGRLVANRNVSAMAHAIADLLRDPDLAARLGDAGRAGARAQQDPDMLIQHERQTYSRMLRTWANGDRARRQLRPSGASAAASTLR